MNTENTTSPSVARIETDRKRDSFYLESVLLNNAANAKFDFTELYRECLEQKIPLCKFGAVKEIFKVFVPLTEEGAFERVKKSLKNYSGITVELQFLQRLAAHGAEEIAEEKDASTTPVCCVMQRIESYYGYYSAAALSVHFDTPSGRILLEALAEAFKIVHDVDLKLPTPPPVLLTGRKCAFLTESLVNTDLLALKQVMIYPSDPYVSFALPSSFILAAEVPTFSEMCREFVRSRTGGFNTLTNGVDGVYQVQVPEQCRPELFSFVRSLGVELDDGIIPDEK